MQNRFFTQAEFNNNFGKEMTLAVDVYERRKESDLEDYSLAKYDFIFISDTKDKLILLSNFLKTNYDYKINEIKYEGDYWELTGDATEFPVDESNLMYWALDLYCKGYEFDCKLDAYGAIGDSANQLFLELDSIPADYYFDKAIEAYNNRNLGMAFVYFSIEIKINPTDPNAWFSRAIIKDELYTWKAARRDYDKAIELAPDFVYAIVNRAANKDEAGEYNEAIEDYTKVLAIDPQNAMAYFNRGNSKFNVNDKKGACEDWTKAKTLGDDSAQERIDKNCM
jgi:tetratricopeptide (TPR) repeat protein